MLKCLYTHIFVSVWHLNRWVNTNLGTHLEEECESEYKERLMISEKNFLIHTLFSRFFKSMIDSGNTCQ